MAPDKAAESIAALTSHPAWMVKRWVKALGVRGALEHAQANNLIPPLTLRVNTASTTREEVLASDLDNAWEVLAEPIQTVMRKAGIEKPYEKLKALTRGQAVSKEILLEFIQTLDIPADEVQRLLELTPESYVGLAAQQARDI